MDVRRIAVEQDEAAERRAEMIAINSMLGVFVFLVGMTLTASIITVIYAVRLYDRSMDILTTAYSCLEEVRRKQEAGNE